MDKYETIEILDDEDLMSMAFAYGASSGDNSTKCMVSCSDTCCC